MSDSALKPEEPKGTRKSTALPIWMPLVGLLSAFVLAIAVGATICPTLSALIFPPGPRLPTTGPVHEISHQSEGTGLDEWVYGTDLSGCAVAQFYMDWLKNCVYDPSVGCKNGADGSLIVPQEDGYHVVQCMGKQVVGSDTLAWTVYVSSGYSKGDKTVFRLIREVAS
jgi:hypothetical protein